MISFFVNYPFLPVKKYEYQQISLIIQPI